MEEAVAHLRRSRSRGSGLAVYDALTFLRGRLSRSVDYVEEDHPSSSSIGGSGAASSAVGRFRELAGPQCLLRLIQSTDSSLKTVDMALSILGNCCLDRDTRKLIGRLQAVPHIVKVFECPSDKTSLMNRACRTLANLALDDRVADDILQSGAIECFVRLLDDSSSPSSFDDSGRTDSASHLKQSAVRAIRVLAATSARRAEVLRHGVVSVLGKLLVSTDEKEVDEGLVGCILRAFVVLSVNCSLQFAEQVQGNHCLERLVKLASSESQEICDPSLHVLANLSCQASVRPLLGNAGVIDCLVRRLGDNGSSSWDRSSPGWQWAVDALCLCTRESVNRVKVRESNGGLGRLVRLLEEPLDGRVWLCALSALVNFLYDDASFTRLVESERLTEALVEKLSTLTKREKSIEHVCNDCPSSSPIPSSRSQGSPCSATSPPSSPPAVRSGHGCAPHACCYSPENSPPYWTSFSSFSPLHQTSMSPSGMSPTRTDFSPEPSIGEQEFCYSPVYESGSSDEEDNVKSSENSVVSENTQETSPVSEHGLGESTANTSVDVDPSTNSRSPIGDILLILSKLSLEEHPRPCFLCSRTLDALVEYVVTVESPQPRAKRILTRIARNPLYLERLVLLRWIVSLRRRLSISTVHSPDECAACESLDAFGSSVQSGLRLQAESPFGVGVLLHLVLAGRNSSEKVSALLATLHLIRSPRSLHKVLVEAGGVTHLTSIMTDADHVDREDVLDGIVCFAPLAIDTVVDPVIAAEQHSSCLYQPALRNDVANEADIVRLSVDDVATDDDGHHVLAHRSVLRDKCDVFAAMFGSNFAESRLPVVVIHDASLEALRYVVHHLYSCDGCSAMTDLAEGTLLQCLVLADKLLLPDVKRTVCRRLMELGRTPSSEIYVHAKMLDCPSLLSWTVTEAFSQRFSVDQRKHLVHTLFTAGVHFEEDVARIFTESIVTKAKL